MTDTIMESELLPPERMQRRNAMFAGTVKFVGPGIGARQVSFIASDDSVDRVGDILMPEGCDMAHFRKNPVLLWSHDGTKPVAKAISINRVGNRIECTAQFPPEGEIEQSDAVYALIRQGLVNATSVGFLPLAGEQIKGSRVGGVRFTSWQLLEISFCTVPCNSNALITQRALDGNREAREALRARARATLESAREAPTRSREEILASCRATLAAARA